MYVAIAVYKIIEMFLNKNTDGWTTYAKTATFKHRNSYALNAIMIIFVSTSLTHLF
jgi:hypothetical protein